MKRDMELIRIILLKIEEKFIDTAIYNLHINGYDTETVAYHCMLLSDAGLITDCRIQYADNGIYSFGVGALTWEGHDFLDKIRDDSTWHKTKEAIKNKGLPLIIDTIKTVATAFITAAAEGIANSVINNGGQV